MIKRVKNIFAVLMLCLLTAPAALAGSVTDELYVMKGGNIYILERTAGLSQERYETQWDDGTVFVSDGANASLTVDGERISRYVLIRDSGDEDEMIVTVDGVNYPMRQVISASGAKYEAAGDPDTVFWSKGSSVTLTVRGSDREDYVTWLPFGGIWLSDEEIPTGVEWRVKNLLGKDIAGNSPMTLTFMDDGSLAGDASVNRYRASWMRSGGRLLISPPASTMMMGGEELMKRESEYLTALSQVTRFKPVKEGLVLVTKDDGEILLVVR